MTGGIINLVANSGAPENMWLENDPQITFFKRVYRRHTLFATEMITLMFKNHLHFGHAGSAKILSYGDLIHRLFFVFDIPKLAAIFPYTKSEDIFNIITTTNLCDHELLKLLKFYAPNSNEIEFDQILCTLDEYLKKYEKEQIQRLGILDLMNNYHDSVTTQYNLNNDINFGNNINLDTEQYTEQFFYLNEKEPRESTRKLIGISPSMVNPLTPRKEPDFIRLKNNLARQWISEKKEYLPIHHLINLIYRIEKPIIEKTPLINDKQIIKKILHANLFYDKIPNEEIMWMHLLRHINLSNDIDLIKRIDEIAMNEYSKLLENKQMYEYFYQMHNTNKYLKSNISDPTTLEIYSLIKKFNFEKNPSMDDVFYEFGPGFHYVLNSYDSVINIINGLATTIPIVTVKILNFDNNTHNIYTDTTASNLYPTYHPVLIDPNFKNIFMRENIDSEYSTINPLNSIVDPVGNSTLNPQGEPDVYVNPYTEFYNDQANLMFDTIRQSLDVLFEIYRDKLFTSTNKLYYNNSLSFSNIYSYVIPTNKYQDQQDLRISNVFNANIWFFYFFKYLDLINENSFTDYVRNNSIINMSYNGEIVMKNLFALLKINIEYFMHEISYLLNDLYASSPSTFPSDSMKNYVPLFGSVGRSEKGVASQEVPLFGSVGRSEKGVASQKYLFSDR